MAWLTVQEIRELFVTESALTVSDGQIENALQSAINYIRRLTGDEVTTAVADAVNNTTNPTADLREAQEYLVLRKLLTLTAAYRVRNGGVMDTERDENASTVNRYATFGDIEKRRAALLAEAERLIEPYLTTEAEEQVFNLNIPTTTQWFNKCLR